MTQLSGEKMNDLVERIKKRMQELGIEIADSSTYPISEFGKGALLSIIAGYIPNKAAVFVAEISYDGSIIFVVENQTRKKYENEIFCQETSTFFPSLKRNSVGAEWSTSVNTYTKESEKEEQRIEKGITFFKEFIIIFGDILEEKFSCRITLHVIPWNSDEFKEREKKLDKDNVSEFFKDLIISKFPEELFPKKN